MSRVSIVLIMLIIMSIICGVVTSMRWHYMPKYESIKLLAGPLGGTYYKEASKIRDVLQGWIDIQVIETNGSLDNLSRMQSGTGDICLYQNIGRRGDELQLIRVLYPERVYVLARKEVTSLWELPAEAHIFIGKPNSGTQVRALQILKQYRLTEQVITNETLNYGELNEAFNNHTIDAAILTLGGTPELIAELLRNDSVHLLDLELREGLNRLTPANFIDVIPANFFGDGYPPKDLPTISNAATLLVNRDFPYELISPLLQKFDEHGISQIGYGDAENYDYPFHPMVIDMKQQRWITSLHIQKLYRIRNWLIATVVFSLVSLFLLIFRRSVQESMDELFVLNGYRARLREIQEYYSNGSDPASLVEDAYALSENIMRDVQNGVVEKTMQLVFIQHEILELVSKLLRREVVVLPKLTEKQCE